jgi:hypothetical protein
MNKRIIDILAIGILSIIVVVTILVLTGSIYGKYGDYIIMGSSIIIGFSIIYLIKKQKK